MVKIVNYMNLPSEGIVDVAPLSRIYDNTVATYKFYWFVSIIRLVSANQQKRLFSFDEIIAGMIAEAWYPIHYFRLSFGKQDSLERNILEIQKILDIPVDAKREVVAKEILAHLDNPAVRRCLHVFTLNVPYRFLSPWIPRATDEQVERYSREYFNHCPYAIMGKSIVLDELWAEYLVRNATILTDYSFWNLSLFLQRRNPNVPDIPSKLIRPIQRAPLTRQHRFWDRYIASVGPIRCIYTGTELGEGGYDLDHFIPWSFVVHDLMWNLLPAAGSVNSSKSDNLPLLERFLAPMAELQHAALRYNFESHPSDKLLEDYLVFRCSIQELVDAPQERFLELFKNEFTPMVQTAANMGFALWDNYPVYA